MSVRSYWYTQFFKQVFANSPAYTGWKSTGGDSFRIMLVTSAYTPNQDIHDVRNDVIGEVSGPGYTAGGHLLTGKTISIASGSLVLAAEPVEWSGATFTVRRAVIYDDTNSSPLSKQLVRWIDFGQDIELSNQTLTITFDNGGEIIINVSSQDIDPPELSIVPVVDGDRISLAYNESLNPTGPATTAFTVTSNAVPVSVSTVAVSGSTVQLGLGSSVLAGETVLLSYVVPVSNPLRDITGNLAAALTSIECSNLTQPPPVDSDPPQLESLVVSDLGLTLRYNELLLNTSVPAVGAFAITVNGVSRVVTAVFVNVGQVFLTLASSVTANQTVLASYTAGGAPIKDLAGNNAANFSSQEVFNATPPEDPPAVNSLEVDTATLTITYNKTLSTNPPPTSAFACTVNGSTRTVTNAVISANTVVLTLGSAVISSDTVLLSYTVPNANPIEDIIGNDAVAYSGLQVQNITTPAPQLIDDSDFISQLVPNFSMVGGGSQSISVTMRNIGTTSWTQGAAYHLYSQNPDGNTTWGVSQVPVASSVLPNSNNTFAFQITAPVTASNYNLQWRMRKLSTEFGDQSQNVSIEVTQSGTAANWYVAKTGSDSNSGAQGLPFLTIGKALSVMKSGDILEIGEGTYPELLSSFGGVGSIPSGVSDTFRTQVRSAAGQTVITNGIDIYSRRYITVKGLICNRYPNHIGRASNTDSLSTFITFDSVTARNWAGGGSGGGGFSVGFRQDSQSCNFLMLNCISHNNGAVGGNQDHGFYVHGRDITIDGGQSFANAGHGIHVYSGTNGATNGFTIRNHTAYGNGSYGIGLYAGINQIAYNNVVYGNGISIAGSGGMSVRFGSVAQLYFNTVYQNTGYGIRVEGSSKVTRNNILYLNTNTAYSDGGSGNTQSNNLVGIDPEFVNATAKNFHLQSSSQAISTGIAVSGITTDFDGTVRLDPPSIGAFEG